MAIEIEISTAMEMEMSMAKPMYIVTILATATIFAMAIKTELTTVPVESVDSQDRIIIPQIPLILNSAGHMARLSINFTLVVYDANLTLVIKRLLR